MTYIRFVPFIFYELMPSESSGSLVLKFKSTTVFIKESLLPITSLLMIYGIRACEEREKFLKHKFTGILYLSGKYILIKIS